MNGIRQQVRDSYTSVGPTSVDQLTVIAAALGRKPIDLFRFREHPEAMSDDGPALTRP